MADYEDSLMVQSARRNKNLLFSTANSLRQRRNAGDKTDYVTKNKDKGKAFSFFRFIKKKTNKTGRFGGRKADDVNDSIKAMDNDSAMPKGAYFDPLGMKIVTPKVRDYFSSDIDAEAEEAQTEKAKQVENDFVNRVDQEILRSYENDFERNRIGDEGNYALVQSREKDKTLEVASADTINKNASHFDAGRAFVPDVFEEDVPDGFNVDLVVNGAPSEFSAEWNQFKAIQTKGVGARIKGVFRKIFGRQAPTEDELFKKFYMGLPEYKRLENEGRQEAKEAGVEYDPELDTNLMKYVSELGEIRNNQGTGHSLVKMNATKNGQLVSSYSFGFVPTANSGMAGAITGLVQNPDKVYPNNSVISKYPVKQSDFLRAAAKIRGTVGAMKTYSMIGYNCSSFAADVGVSAGIDIKANDTSDLIMTHRHRSQRVDSPYRLAKFLKAQNEEKEKKQNAQESENDHYAISKVKEKSPESVVQGKTQKITDEYKNKIYQSNVYKMMVATGDSQGFNVISNFKTYVSRILTDEEKINSQYPITDLKDEKLEKALHDRASAKQVVFGEKSVNDAIETAFKPWNERALYCILTDTHKSTFDLENLKKEAAKKEKEKLENEEKERKKIEKERSEAERLEARKRQEAQKAKEKEGKRQEITEDVNPEGTATTMKEEKRDLPAEPVSAPPKMSKKLIKGMLADMNKFGLSINTFVSVFKAYAGIEGRSTISMKKLSDHLQLVDFLYACNKNSAVGAVFPQLYADILNAKTNVEQNEKYTELLNTITANYSRETLKSLFCQYYIY